MVIFPIDNEWSGDTRDRTWDDDVDAIKFFHGVLLTGEGILLSALPCLKGKCSAKGTSSTHLPKRTNEILLTGEDTVRELSSAFFVQ